MITKPDDYARLHYYPRSYNKVAHFSPKSSWVEIPDPSKMDEAMFTSAIEEVRKWGCEFVFMKDYVKSHKNFGGQFMKEAVSSLEGKGQELVKLKAENFNQGVVYKEWI